MNDVEGVGLCAVSVLRSILINIVSHRKSIDYNIQLYLTSQITAEIQDRASLTLRNDFISLPSLYNTDVNDSHPRQLISYLSIIVPVSVWCVQEC